MNNDSRGSKAYLSAAGKDWLLRFYDPAVRLLGLDSYYFHLIEFSDFGPHQKILDIGCGTGTVGKIIKQAIHEADFTGIDPDPKALAVAKRKLSQYSRVQLDLGYGNDLPYSDAIFDHVMSSFVIHHLSLADRIGMLHEVQRVLKGGSTFCAVDFDGDGKCGEDKSMSTPDLLLLAGFHSIEVITDNHWLLGKVSFYSASK